ncbi:MAG: hypothetical protein WC091_18245 [Sulfuricellaceae bacterium]
MSRIHLSCVGTVDAAHAYPPYDYDFHHEFLRTNLPCGRGFRVANYGYTA